MSTSGAPRSGSRHVPPIFVSRSAREAELAQWAHELPRPRAILVVSALWQATTLTRGATAGWPLAGPWRGPTSAELAYDVHQLLPVARAPEHLWDEGVTDALGGLYAHGGIPALQLSLVLGATPRTLFAIGRALGPLAERGVLIAGVGSIIHDQTALDPRADAEPLAWARELDAWVGNALADADLSLLLRWRSAAPHARLAHGREGSAHLDPLFVVAGAASLYEHAVGFPVRGIEHACVTRRCVQLGRPT